VEPAKKLPTFQDECVLDCVSTETVRKLITGGFRHLYDSVMVIDCRFDFEFEGGHLKADQPGMSVSCTAVVVDVCTCFGLEYT
jgi:hypothetical protein